MFFRRATFKTRTVERDERRFPVPWLAIFGVLIILIAAFVLREFDDRTWWNGYGRGRRGWPSLVLYGFGLLGYGIYRFMRDWGDQRDYLETRNDIYREKYEATLGGQRFARAVVHLLVLAAAADVIISDKELSQARKRLRGLFGKVLTEQQIEREIQEATLSYHSSMLSLRGICDTIKETAGDAERLMLVEACVSVLFADGKFPANEERFLRRLGQFLDISETELQSIFYAAKASWQRARNGQPDPGGEYSSGRFGSASSRATGNSRKPFNDGAGPDGVYDLGDDGTESTRSSGGTGQRSAGSGNGYGRTSTVTGTGMDWAFHTLGLPRGASIAQIKAQYRKLAMKYHPDRSAHLGPEVAAAAEARFKAITRAHDALLK